MYVFIDTRVGSERESRPRGSLNHFYGIFLLDFHGQSFLLLFLCVCPHGLACGILVV